LRTSCVIRIEQNFGSHIEQNFTDLNTSCAILYRNVPAKPGPFPAPSAPFRADPVVGVE
jgi:hypothetical protein